MFYVAWLVQTCCAITHSANWPGMELVHKMICIAHSSTKIMTKNPSGTTDYQGLFLLLLAVTWVKHVHWLQSCSSILLKNILSFLMFLDVVSARLFFAPFALSIFTKHKLLDRKAERIGDQTVTAEHVCRMMKTRRRPSVLGSAWQNV